MKILVIGASKGIGKAVVAEALERGHSVRAFARSADSMDPREGLEPVVGDATQSADLRAALDGTDAVVMTLGIRESMQMLWKEVTLFSDATNALVPLMEDLGPRRLIAVTGIGAGESARALSKPERIGHRIVFSKPYKDKTRQEKRIMASALDWTIVRPTVLTNNKASRSYRVMMEPETWRMGMISRADVADYVLNALEDPDTIHRAPVLAR
ncbi:NAD(P)-dependent oxidoreductase [Cognatishimia sp. F0-27]|uniref:NAD(P)-dependent oxidoreductase n=1 Tax=Cognatishimia sp. F0-27 TaxID=2816855 RepID=UPI001D0C1D6A|nr:NAD(P)-binding oxidoreductase [Cognatishimia sp. F0-27]MCC1494448.1 SDR family oxidoreductase [Cognatishimia sp. F0-27]